MVFHNGQTYQQVILNGVQGYIIYGDTTCFYAIKPDTNDFYSDWISTFSPADCGNPTNFDNGALWDQYTAKTREEILWEFNSDTNIWTIK
ncbi:hypothetical protein BSQ38_05225 [Pediococcus damnosus]|nr:hypothetical protein [Pediococcus damnosus]PIO81092.1 hypothetical protein BSQ38_05225 [Pediococcus damnosus]